MRSDLSVVIIANNASLRIGEVIGAARQISDDIIVLDSGSEDGTVDIATDLGARIYHQEWLGYSATKNIGNALAHHDMILSLDSDEVLSHELIDTLSDLTFESGTIYELDRANYFSGQRIRFSHWNPDHIPRLFNRNHARWKGDFVHEKLSYDPGMKIKLLRGKLIHYSYENFQQRLDKVRNYARLSAHERFQNGKRTNMIWAFFSSVSKFFITYFLHLGILDGVAGFQIALTDACQTWQRSKIMVDLQKGIQPECCK